MILNKKKRYLLNTFICLLTLCLFSNCSKQEAVWEFNNVEPADTTSNPVTDIDTTISVTAILNDDTFKALGRAEPPDEKLTLTFADIHSDAYLKLILSADTPGTYLMNRNIAAHTAVWYDTAGNSYTSRATDSAGGTVTISEVDTVNHRVKGAFDLLMASRSDSNRYMFKEGNFDMLYNHVVASIGTVVYEAKTIDETLKNLALSSGTATNPEPVIIATLNDSFKLTVKFLDYDGTRTYNLTESDKIKITLQEISTGKIFTADSGELTLVRFNYKAFIQLLFNSHLKADDGAVLELTKGSIVVGI